jgi:hypothetical protein
VPAALSCSAPSWRGMDVRPPGDSCGAPPSSVGVGGGDDDDVRLPVALPSSAPSWREMNVTPPGHSCGALPSSVGVGVPPSLSPFLIRPPSPFPFPSFDSRFFAASRHTKDHPAPARSPSHASRRKKHPPS